MSIATKNGLVILKDGKPAESCACCGCSPELAFQLWQRLVKSQQSMTVSGTIPERHGATFANLAYVTATLRGGNYYVHPSSKNAAGRKGSIADFLSSGDWIEPTYQDRHSNVYVKPQEEYRFGTYALAVDLSATKTFWSQSLSAGDVTFAGGDSRCSVKMVISVTSKNPSLPNQFTAQSKCACTASYSIATTYGSAADAVPLGTRMSVTTRDTVGSNFGIKVKMGFATVSPEMYASGIPTNYLPGGLLAGANDVRRATLGSSSNDFWFGAWSQSMKPEGVSWQTGQEMQVSGNLMPNEDAIEANVQASMQVPPAQWLNLSSPTSAWASDLLFASGSNAREADASDGSGWPSLYVADLDAAAGNYVPSSKSYQPQSARIPISVRVKLA